MRKLGIAAKLVLIEGTDNHERDLPESVDSSLLSGYPDWITKYSRFDKRFGRLANDFDIGLTVGPSGLKAVTKISAIPTVHLVVGSEVWDLPLRYTPPHSQALQFCHRVYYRLASQTTAAGRRREAMLSRKAISKSRVLLADFEPVIRATEQIGATGKVRVWPTPEDVEGNQARVDTNLLESLNNKYGKYKRTILWLSRVNFADKKASAYKGAENFLAAFKRLVHEDQADVRAIVGTHGEDIEAFKSLAQQWKLDDHIDFVPHLPLWKLLTYMAIDNAIVCDQMFDMNCITGLAREGLCLGTAFVMGVDQRLMQISYGAALPVERATDSVECLESLRKLYALSSDGFAARQESVRAWTRQYLDYRVVIPRLTSILEEVDYLYRCGTNLP
ncbi:hypothetical protein UC8_06120 [Roseimaritima ulvae]|uniref:Glycosyl transferases group 1 n=2 Tax=Roseimaritima ulvae TaxID=980254 RepID=A0A5B9QIE7_9BACT|nr:hypothetical protein UC8_06120 [Roseimaritima ulvae]